MTATHHRSSRNDANATIGFNPYRGRLPVCCDTASVVTLLACITPAALEIPKSRMRWLARLGIFYLVSTSMAWTQEPAITPSAPDQGLPSADASTNGEKPETDSDSASAALSSEQDQIAEKYRRLEMLMLRMAEFDANSNPRRAALLKQALSRSKENHIATDMKQLVDLLTQQELQQAVDQQSEVNVNLRQVLDLLQSENRADRLKSEQQRVKGYIQQLERILRQQRSLQGRTEGGEDTERLAQEQGNVGDRADELSKEIDKNEQTTPPAGQPPNDAKPSDGSPPKSSDEPKPNDQPESSEENAPGDGDQKEPSQADGKNEQQGSKQTEGTDTPKGEKESDEKSNTNDEQNRADDSQNAEEPQEGEDVRAEKTDGSIIEGQLKKKNAERVEIEDQQGNQTDIPREELKKIERKKQSDSPQGQPQPSDGQTPTDEKPTDSKPSSDTPQQPAPGSPQNSPPSPGDGQPGESQSQTPPPSQDQPQPSFPGQKSIQQARQKMRDAQKKLEQSQRDGAVEEQEEARRLLEQAKAELEEILRQMREEEVQRTLADLESRFRKMLEWQIKVYEDTQTLDKLPPDQRATQQVVQSGKLSLDERKILGEADKALLLLREEGSSVAFPEAVEQMRSDIETVVDRLSQVKIDSITIGIEEDIIAALEEVVAALQKAQQDAEQRRQQQQQQQQPSDPQDQPLVDAIAELKMIRTLQVRVNKRTDDYAKRLSDPEHEVGQATQQDLLGELRQLAGRELRIRQLTRDIVLGKNQ